MTTENPFNQMYQFTSLGRAVDPSYRTNLIILILSPALAIAAGAYSILSGADLWAAIQTAFWAGLTAFLTWALAREVDIDYPWSAFVAVAIAMVALVLLDFPAIAALAIFMLMAAIRTTSRVIGLKLKLGDSVVLLASTVLLAFTDYWLLGIVIAAALLLDGSMNDPLRRNLGFAVAALVVVIVRGILDAGGAGTLTTFNLMIVVVIDVLYLLTLLATRTVKSKPDYPGTILDIRRVRAAMGLVLLTGFIVAIWNGDAGVIAFIPLWSSMLATALYRLPITIAEWRAFNERNQT